MSRSSTRTAGRVCGRCWPRTSASTWSRARGEAALGGLAVDEAQLGPVEYAIVAPTQGKVDEAPVEGAHIQ
jgi:hypothetical protein